VDRVRPVRPTSLGRAIPANRSGLCVFARAQGYTGHRCVSIVLRVRGGVCKAAQGMSGLGVVGRGSQRRSRFRGAAPCHRSRMRPAAAIVSAPMRRRRCRTWRRRGGAPNASRGRASRTRASGGCRARTGIVRRLAPVGRARWDATSRQPALKRREARRGSAARSHGGLRERVGTRLGLTRSGHYVVALTH
jgi:hypothetical protein